MKTKTTKMIRTTKDYTARAARQQADARAKTTEAREQFYLMPYAEQFLAIAEAYVAAKAEDAATRSLLHQQIKAVSRERFAEGTTDERRTWLRLRAEQLDEFRDVEKELLALQYRVERALLDVRNGGCWFRRSYVNTISGTAGAATDHALAGEAIGKVLAVLNPKDEVL